MATSETSSSPSLPAPPPPPPPPLPALSKVTSPVVISKEESNPSSKNGGKLRIISDDQGVIHAPDVWNQSPHTNENEEWKKLRIVCISDTHLRHEEFLRKIPEGDVLIHSGDFFKNLNFAGSHKERKEGLSSALTTLNNFMQKLPHKLKIFVAGNHETAFNGHTQEEIQAHLPNCVYLQDSSISIANNSIKIYGSPWTSSSHMGFSAPERDLAKRWAQIPEDVDILITHLPPFNVLDLAFENRGTSGSRCEICGEKHRNRAHWGSPSLLERVGKVKPTVHVFGHVHDIVGASWGPRFSEKYATDLHSKYKEVFFDTNRPTLFVNSAMDIEEHPIFFDYHYKEHQKHPNEHKCLIS